LLAELEIACLLFKWGEKDCYKTWWG
jgi:hypothetical protein